MTTTNDEGVRDEKLAEVAAQIQTLLEDNDLAIQPLLNYSATSITPSVRLVSTKEKELSSNEIPNDEQEGDTTETAGDQKEDGASEPEPA